MVVSRKKEAGSPPKRRTGPSPTRAQRVNCASRDAGSDHMRERLTGSGANSLMDHFCLNRHCEEPEGRRSNPGPAAAAQVALDCFATLAMPFKKNPQTGG